MPTVDLNLAAYFINEYQLTVTWQRDEKDPERNIPSIMDFGKDYNLSMQHETLPLAVTYFMVRRLSKCNTVAIPLSLIPQPQ
ncbi:hypothetical protein D3C71_1934320 [compost metagenome]